jgi:hypothetical protein
VIHQRGVSRRLLPQLAQGFNYVLNRVPRDSVHGDIPFELFFGKELASLRHLRVLGAPCSYVIHNPGAKLASRTRPGTFVGYDSDGNNGTAVYRVYDEDPKVVIVTRDVYVSEEEFSLAPAANPDPPEQKVMSPKRNGGAQESAHNAVLPAGPARLPSVQPPVQLPGGGPEQPANASAHEPAPAVQTEPG